MKCPVCGFDRYKNPRYPIQCICGTRIFEDGTFKRGAHGYGVPNTIAPKSEPLPEENIPEDVRKWLEDSNG